MFISFVFCYFDIRKKFLPIAPVSLLRRRATDRNFLHVWRVLCRCERVLLLRADRADRLTEVATAAAPVHVVRNEAEAPRVARVVLVERRRPIVAVVADTVETRVVAIARSGKKNGVTIRFASYSVAIDAVLRGPRPSAVGL